MDVGRLKTIPLFESVPEECLRRIDAFVKEASVSPGTELVKEGEYAYELMAIEEGTAEVRRGGEKIAELGPGDVFGEMGVLERELRSASVVATSVMRLISLSTWEIKRMETHMPETVERIRRTAESRRVVEG